jgi:hypothetical protein
MFLSCENSSLDFLMLVCVFLDDPVSPDNLLEVYCSFVSLTLTNDFVWVVVENVY